MKKKVLIEISARHVHLSQNDLEKLFGRGYELQKFKDLTQASDFATKETLAVVGPKGMFPKVRIIGPVRKDSQVEVSATDARFLGIDAPVRISGNVENTPGITLNGPKGKIKIKRGVIVAARHLHAGDQQAKVLKIKNGSRVSIKVGGSRGIIFNNVITRVHPQFNLALHIDTDEANAAGIKGGDKGELFN
jgi:putative phosphotransacetylase